MPETIQPRSPEPTIYREQMAKMVRDRTEFSREESVAVRRSFNRYYDLYRGYIRARSQPFRNQVQLPLLFSSIETGISIKHGLLTGQKPWMVFVPSGPDDAPSSRRTTSLIQQQFDDAQFDAKLATLMRMGDITGTAVAQWSWRHVKNTRPTRVPDPTDPTGAAFQVITQEMVDFDGPWVDIVDILDFHPQPSRPTITEMDWAIRRYWLDYDDVVRLANEGVYDIEALEDLKFSRMGDEAQSEFENRRAAPGGLRWSMPNIRMLDKYSKPVEILEFHGIVPDELVPEDGFRNRLVTVGNGTVTLRNVANPIWSGGLPFACYSPTPDPYSFYGIGKVEPNDKLQATANRLASQKLDAIDLLIDPMFAYDQLANVETRRLFVRSGGFVGGDGPPQNWLMPIFPDMRGLQQGLMEIESLWRWMQHGTGVTEEAIGMPAGGGGDRQTAREFLGRMENVQRRMVREALHAANTLLLPIAEAFRAMDAQFLPFPQMLRRMGTSAIIDPQTGAPIPPDQSVTLQDVILRYDMRAESATNLVGRSAKQQNKVMLLQALGGPLQNPIINWMAFYRSLFMDFEEPNPDEFILPLDPRLLQMATMASMMPSPDPGAKDSGGKKTPGTSSGVNKDLLDQMVTPEPQTANPMGVQ